MGAEIRLDAPVPVEHIKRMRSEGESVEDIARQVGISLRMVRRVLGTLDPHRWERIVEGIEREGGSRVVKIRKWKAETGKSDTTYWRTLRRLRGSGG
ncbi:MAG: hypothetical protein K2X87_16995 [Gemmataceae bacterium]|nr:hypothetical protein [Gemmataceae bacterium]